MDLKVGTYQKYQQVNGINKLIIGLNFAKRQHVFGNISTYIWSVCYRLLNGFKSKSVSLFSFLFFPYIFLLRFYAPN